MSDRSESNRAVLKAQVVPPAEPRWVVLVMLFLLMGVLGVPMLWRSPHFSRRAKAALTICAVFQTVVALAAIAWAVAWFLHRISAMWG